MSDQEYSARDKIVNRMTRDGLEEVNVTQGTSKNVSKRLSEYSFDKKTAHDQAFEGHARFRGEKLRADKAAGSLEKKASRSAGRLIKTRKNLRKQGNKFLKKENRAKMFLPRPRISRATGLTLHRVVKKSANTYTLRERLARGVKRKAWREAEEKTFEGEGSENVGLEASHKLYRTNVYRHRYKHRKDYLKSKRHKRYRAYVKSRERLTGLQERRQHLTFEFRTNRYLTKIASLGEEKAQERLSEAQKRAVRHERQKRAYKKKYQKAIYAAEHGTGSGLRYRDLILKKDARKRVVQEAKAIAAAFGGILSALFSVIGFAGLLAIGVIALVFICMGQTGTTDTDLGSITECDAYFSEKETVLREEILQAEADRAGYDEYRYFVNGSQVSAADDMASYITEHDPIILSALLAVQNNDYALSNSSLILDEIFSEMYSLEYEEKTETRHNDHGEEYDVEILELHLTVKELTDVAQGYITSENQRSQYELLIHTEGNQQIFSNPFDFDWTGDISSDYGWRIHPISGDKKFHAGLDIAEPQGTEIHACSAGTVTIAKYSSSAGNYIAIRDKDGYVIKYMHCHALYVKQGDTVEREDVIAIVGTTGNSTGNHLHLQIEDPSGNTLNPLFWVRSS